MNNFFLIIGIVGMGLILLAFLMEQLGKWKNSFFIYDSVNFVGALLMVIYAYSIKSWPFLILNIVWMLFSLTDSIKDLEGK